MLVVDGEAVGEFATDRIFALMVSWSGLDIGLDRGTTVTDYEEEGRFVGPYAFTGNLVKVVVELDDDQKLNQDKAAAIALARE